MSLLKSRNASIFITTLFIACAHQSARDRQPSSLSATGLGDAALQKKLDQTFQTNGGIQKLSAKGTAESSGTSVQELHDKSIEGSVFEWKDQDARVSRLVVGKIVHPLKRADEGNFYTLASGARAGSSTASLSQLHLSSSGDLVSLTKCEMPKGSAELRCFEANEDSCWTLFKPKSLAETPSKQVDWKAQACALGTSIAVSVDEIFADANEWGESLLTQDSSVTGVGNNRILFNEDLKAAFSTHKSAKSAEDFKALVAGVQKLNCSISEVRSSEEDTIEDYMKLFRPVAVECQRLQKIFPKFGQAQAVASETKKTRPSPTAHKSAPVKKKKKKPSNKKTRWIWQK